jgi:hypothetical protein
MKIYVNLKYINNNRKGNTSQCIDVYFLDGPIEVTPPFSCGTIVRSGDPSLLISFV